MRREAIGGVVEPLEEAEKEEEASGEEGIAEGPTVKPRPRDTEVLLAIERAALLVPSIGEDPLRTRGGGIESR